MTKYKGGFKKGNIPWNKDIKVVASDKQKKYWNSMKGKVPIALEGFQKGHIPWNKKYEIKMIKCACGCGKEFNQNDTSNHKSKYYSLECYWKSKNGNTPWNKGLTKEVDKRLIATKERTRKALRRRVMSSLETKVQSVINKYNLPYKFVGNGKFFIERKNPDFININGEKKAVEVYCRKHKELFRGNCDKWKEDRNKIFNKYGWSIIFIEDWQTNKEEDVLQLMKGGN